jgi:palmitoyl-protein thioesterase
LYKRNITKIGKQTYKTRKNYDEYLQKSIFLNDINNEVRINKRYGRNLNTLTKLILIRFMDDITVVPRDSAWFSFYDRQGNLTNLVDSELYNTLGLKKMDEDNKIVFETLEGGHMQIGDESLQRLVMTYFANDVKSHVIAEYTF